MMAQEAINYRGVRANLWARLEKIQFVWQAEREQKIHKLDVLNELLERAITQEEDVQPAERNDRKPNEYPINRGYYERE